MSSALDVPALLVLALITVSEHEPAASPHAQTPPAVAPAAMVRAAGRIYCDDDWLRSFRNHGAAVGHGSLSQRIFKTGSGRHYVPVVSDRQEIMGLKRNPQTVADIVAQSGREHASHLAPLLGRRVVARDLLAAHMLGVAAAAKLLDEAARNPAGAAAEAIPKAALAHPTLFFAGTRPRSTEAVVRMLQSEIDLAIGERPRIAALPGVPIGGWRTATVARR